MFRPTSKIILLALAATAAFPASGQASSAVVCSLDGQYESIRSTAAMGLIRHGTTNPFSVRGNAVCTGLLEAQLVRPGTVSFALDGRRTALPGQNCLGTATGQLTMRILKRTGWVVLRSRVRMLSTDGGALDGVGRAGAVAGTLVGRTSFAPRGAQCKGAFRANFALVPSLAGR